MLGAFSSEWVKLRRRSMLLWGLGGGLLFTVLATVFTIERATKTLAPGFHGRGFRITAAELSRPDGLVHGVVDVSNLVGIVALCLFAGAAATAPSRPPPPSSASSRSACGGAGARPITAGVPCAPCWCASPAGHGCCV